MTDITDLMKCPNCHRKGTMDLTIRKKNAKAQCEVCKEIVESRVPYPKHRSDHEGYQYYFKIPSIRPIWTNEDDDVTCSQEEWKNVRVKSE